VARGSAHARDLRDPGAAAGRRRGGPAADRLAEIGVTDFNAVLVPVAGDPECEARTRAWLAARARAG